MTLFRQFLMAWLARRDARTGVESARDHVIVAQGPRPRFDPVNDNRHARLVHDAGLLPAIEEAEEDERRAEDQLAEYADPRLLTAAFYGLIIAEFCGGLFVARSLGFEGPERIITAALLALAMIALVTFTVKQGSEQRDGAPPRRGLFYGLLAALGALVAAISILRVQEVAVDGEETSRLGNVAASIVAVAVATGPAAVAELVLRARRAALPALQQLKRARRRLKELRRRHDRANKGLERLAERRERFDREEAQTLAAYGREHRRTTALLDTDRPALPDPDKKWN